MTDKQTDNLVPKLRFLEFNNKGEWERKTIEEILTVNSGRDYKHLQPGNIPVYGTGGYMLSVNDKLSDVDAIGIGRKGTIDKPQYLKAPFWTVDTLFYLTKKYDYNLIFLFYLLQTIEWKKYSEQTGVPSLTRASIEGIEVKVPKSLEEQQKIATCLSTIDSYISSINEKIEQLKAHKKSLMQKLFPQNGKTVPEYRFPEFEKDEGWTEKRLGDFLKIRNGYAFKSNTYITSGKFKIVTIRNVKKGRLEMGEYNTINNLPTDIQPHQILKRGNILVSMTGNVGRVCKVDCDNCLQNQRVGLIEKYTTTIDEDFVFTILTDACFEQAMIESGQGAAQTNIGNKDIEDYSFLCPPSLSEQNQIALCLSPIESLTSYYMDKVALLEQFMVGLTQQLFPKQQAL